MEHIYQRICGWFDFHDLYRAQVDRAPDAAHFVEVGCYLGKSTAAMAVEIVNSGKAIRFDTVDTFEGVPPEEGTEFAASEDYRAQAREIAEHGSLEQAARANLAPVAEYVTVRVMGSLEAAATYADASLDFVYLDNNHTEQHVLQELDAWWPKVKPGGVLAGHDYNWASVKVAVDVWHVQQGLAMTPVSASSWAIRKPVRAASWTVPEAARSCLVAVCSNERTIARQTTESLIRLSWGQRVLSAASRHGFRTVDFAWFHKYVLVSALREEAIQRALDAGYSHVLFLDADMTWPSDVLARMLAHHGRGVVSGLYHLRAWPHWPVALRDGRWNPVTLTTDYTYDEMGAHADTLRRETLVGMGCTLVPVEACRRMGRPWFKYQDDRRGLGTITEDVWFCQRAAEVDCPIWLDPAVVCGHMAADEVRTPHFDRATYEMAMLGNGQRLKKTEPIIPR